MFESRSKSKFYKKNLNGLSIKKVEMKSILLFRHGKSDWNASYKRDHDRPLSKRGVKAAKIIPIEGKK